MELLVNYPQIRFVVVDTVSCSSFTSDLWGQVWCSIMMTSSVACIHQIAVNYHLWPKRKERFDIGSSRNLFRLKGWYHIFLYVLPTCTASNANIQIWFKIDFERFKKYKNEIWRHPEFLLSVHMSVATFCLYGIDPSYHRLRECIRHICPDLFAFARPLKIIYNDCFSHWEAWFAIFTGFEL